MKSLPEKFVPKGWGWERWIVNGAAYCGKQLWFAKGKKFSFHFHKKKEETFFVADGKVTLIHEAIPKNFDLSNKAACRDFYKAICYGRENVTELEAGDVFHVHTWMGHQIIAQTDALIYEFSTHHEDSDSYRLIKGD